MSLILRVIYFNEVIRTTVHVGSSASESLFRVLFFTIVKNAKNVFQLNVKIGLDSFELIYL